MTKRRSEKHTQRRNDLRTRRGSTLLMVLTAMSACLILSGAFVASRSNGTVIGSNLIDASKARVAAESSLAITLHALQQDTRWRTSHINGILFEQSENGTHVRVELTDLATGDPPTADTVDIRASIRATAGEIERIAEADVFVALPEDSNSLDVDLGEFALFAGDSITLRSEAIVQPWGSSPANGRGHPIRVATALGTPGAIGISNAAAIVDGVEFRPSGGSSHGSDLPVADLPDNVAVPAPAPPDDFAHAPVMTEPGNRITTDTRLDALELRNGDVLELANGANLLIENDFQMRPGAVLRVEGSTDLVVHGNVQLRDAHIEVPETAELDFYVGGDIDFRDTTLTEPSGTVESWIPDLDRVRILSLATRETMPTWRFRGTSVIKGECYAPGANVKVQGCAVLIGRIAAQTIVIEGRACLLYEPALDNGNGYTANKSRAYDLQGNLSPALANLDDLSPENLTEASEILDIPLSAHDTYVEPQREIEPEQRTHYRQHPGRRGRSSHHFVSPHHFFGRSARVRGNIVQAHIRAIGVNIRQHQGH